MLKLVERGELPGAEFMSGIAALTAGLVAAHTAPLPEYASLFAPPPKGAVVGKCPRCGADVTESAKGFFCSNRACKFALWKDNRFFAAKGKKLDKNTAAALLKRVPAKPQGFVGEGGTTEHSGCPSQDGRSGAQSVTTLERVFFSDLKSEKTGKTYAAAIVLEDDGEKTNYKLDFSKKERAAA
jgi:DNA topoisomerase-3